MKLLIDIPEHIYEHAKEMSEDSRDEGEAMRAIANGSPARCMDEAEKERLIKKNMLSIENRVRNVFNQGYEMGVKKNKSEIPNTCGDAISRQAVDTLVDELARAISDERCYMSRGRDTATIMQDILDLPSITPQSCEDVISRREALNAITMAEVRWQAVDNVNKLPSVTPQQRTGRWIWSPLEYNWHCSECQCADEEDKPLFRYCPMCGCKMEVEE